MFENFGATYPQTSARPTGEEVLVDTRALAVAGYSSFMSERSGCTFGDGVYRVHTVQSAARVEGSVREAFPDHDGRLSLFGFDWCGRQFALDFGRTEGAATQIVMLEPGTGALLRVPVDFVAFHDEAAVVYADDLFAASLYQGWRALPGSRAIGFDECVGYIRPLFLGGIDDLENVEISDLDVYWSVCSQLWAQVRDLPPGTAIGGVRIE